MKMILWGNSKSSLTAAIKFAVAGTVMLSLIGLAILVIHGHTQAGGQFKPRNVALLAVALAVSLWCFSISFYYFMDFRGNVALIRADGERVYLVHALVYSIQRSAVSSIYLSRDRKTLTVRGTSGERKEIPTWLLDLPDNYQSGEEYKIDDMIIMARARC